MPFHLLPIRRLAASFVLFLALAFSSSAAEVILNLSGKEIVLGRQFRATSGAAKLPASRVYDYVLEGSVRGTGDLAPLIPPGTSLASLAATFGGTIPLEGRVNNPSGRLPFNVVNKSFTRTILIDLPIAGTIPVETSLKVSGGIAGNGSVQFSFLLDARPVLGSIPIIGVGGIGAPKGTIIFESGSSLAIESFFDPFAGRFVGLIDSTPFVPGRQGIARLNVTLGGLMTGTLQFRGGTYRIKTGLNADLSSPEIRLGNTGFSARFTANASNVDEIGVEVRLSGIVVASATLQRAPILEGPLTARVGAYTIALVPPPLEAGQTPATHPVGHGYLTATVTPVGNVLLTGQLCDGKPLASASAMLADETIPFYSGVSKGAGSVFGSLALQGESDPDDVTGTLRWIKPATPADRIFKGEFDINLTARGSRYLAPLPGDRVLGLASGNFVLTGGNLSIPLTIPFSLSERNVFSLPSASGLKVTAVKRKGLLQGKFKASATTPAVPLRGVLLQKQNSGSGFFIGNPGASTAAESGRFEITP